MTGAIDLYYNANAKGYITIAGDGTDNASLNLSGKDLKCSEVTNNGVLKIGNGSTLTLDKLTNNRVLQLEGTESFSAVGSVVSAAGSTVEYYGTTADTTNWISKVSDGYKNLLIDSGAVLKIDASSGTEVKAVNVTNNGTVNVSGKNLTVLGTLTNNSTISVSKNLTVSGNLTNNDAVSVLQNGKLDFVSYTGDGTNDKISVTEGTLTHSGTDDVTVTNLETTTSAEINGTTASGKYLTFTNTTYNSADLTTTGNVKLPETVSSDTVGNITVNSGSLTTTGAVISGDLTVTSGTFTNNAALTCGALNINGTFTQGSVVTADSVTIGTGGTFTVGANTITVKGNWTDNSESGFSAGTGLVKFDGTNTEITVKEKSEFNKVEAASTKITLGENLKVKNEFKFTKNLEIDNGNYESTFSGAVLSDGTKNLTFSGTGKVTFESTLDSAGNITIGGNTVFGGAVGTTSVTSLSVSGTSTINGGTVKTTGNQTYTGSVTATDCAFTGNDISFNGAASISGGSLSGRNISFADTASFTDDTAVTPTGLFTLTGNAAITDGKILTVKGNFKNDGTVSGGTLKFTGESGDDFDITSNAQITSLIVIDSDGTETLKSALSAKDLTITKGTLTSSNNSITLTGDLDNSGTISISGSTTEVTVGGNATNSGTFDTD